MLSTPFESCKQDLSFGGCHFSVSYLVPEILATTWRQRHIRFGINARIEPKMTSSFSHISANISGTRKDTETLHPPNERSCLQLSNGVHYVPVAFIVWWYTIKKRCCDFAEHQENFFESIYHQNYDSYKDLKHAIWKLQARSLIWWV